MPSRESTHFKPRGIDARTFTAVLDCIVWVRGVALGHQDELRRASGGGVMMFGKSAREFSGVGAKQFQTERARDSNVKAN